MTRQVSGSLYMFVSFDLCNSGTFKYLHRDWVKLYLRIFDLIRAEMISAPAWQFWKANGDELLFYLDTVHTTEIAAQIERVDCINKRSIKTIYSEFQATYDDIHQLSIKATVWVAQVADPKCEKCVAAEDYIIDLNGVKDFTGKETDIGFRISKYAPRSKTTISAYLTYILLKQRSHLLRNVRVGGYVRLKGVWMDKKYPIVWYIRAQDKASIKKSFHYDESDENKLIKSFIENLEREGCYGVIENSEFENMLDYLGVKNRYDREMKESASSTGADAQ